MSDLTMAIESLEDELEGIGSYTKMLESVKCPELSEIFKAARTAEKQHAAHLLRWINAAATEVIG